MKFTIIDSIFKNKNLLDIEKDLREQEFILNSHLINLIFFCISTASLITS